MSETKQGTSELHAPIRQQGSGAWALQLHYVR